MALTPQQRLAASTELLNRLAVHERFVAANVVMLFHSCRMKSTPINSLKIGLNVKPSCSL